MRVAVDDSLAMKVDAVYCDGEKLKLCILADEEEGYALCYKNTDSKIDPVKHEGKIEITWREDE